MKRLLAPMLLAAAGPALATSGFRGGDLVTLYDNGPTGHAIVMGYVAGVLDGDDYLRPMSSAAIRGSKIDVACLPPGLEPGAISKVVVDYVRSAPHVYSESAYWVVRYVASSAWPCTRK